MYQLFLYVLNHLGSCFINSLNNKRYGRGWIFLIKKSK